MDHEDLLARVTVDPAVCTGIPSIRGTRICIATVLDAMAEGFTTAEILDHDPSLDTDNIRSAVACAAGLARENLPRTQPARS